MASMHEDTSPTADASKGNMPTALKPFKEMHTKTKASLFSSPSLYKLPFSHLTQRRRELQGSNCPSIAMAKILRCLWDRAQGKYHLQIICNKVFYDYADKEKRRLPLNDLHIATLRVYNSVNKQFLSPHMEPPSIIVMTNIIKDYCLKGIKEITREQFYDLIMGWIKKDLRLVLANKVALASLVAPVLATTTKNAGRRGSPIKKVIEKIPTPLLFSIYFVGLVLLQDVRVD